MAASEESRKTETARSAQLPPGILDADRNKPMSRNRCLGMDNRNLVRDSLVIFAIVVLSAYAVASALNLVVGATPSNQAAGSIVLVVVSFLIVLGLGFLLWRAEAGPLRTRLERARIR
jgi:hypothetical protein